MAKVSSIVTVLLAGLCLIVTAQPAAACSCIMPGPACENYSKVEHVFDGTVLSISETSHTENVAGRDWRIRQRLVRFQVHRAYKGVTGAEVEVVTGFGGGDCGYDFRPGARYLVFGWNRSPWDGRIQAGICSATQPYDMSSDAVAFLDGLSRPSAGGAIFGTVFREDRSFDSNVGTQRQPVDGVTVVLEGAKGQRKTIVRNGRYRFTDLPPGEYVVRPELAASLWQPPQPISASLADAHACAERDIQTAINGRIGGLVLRHDSTPASHVRVELAPADADLDARQFYPQPTQTDETGRFEFERLPPGRYIVGVNLRDMASSSVPYPRTLFPGPSPDVPAAVTLGNGEAASIGTLTLPAPAGLRRISGVVLGLDGKPAPNVSVFANEVSRDRPRRAAVGLSNSSGVFEIEVRSHGRYVLQAFVRQQSRVIGRAESGVLPVSDSDLSNVHLRLQPAEDDR